MEFNKNFRDYAMDRAIGNIDTFVKEFIDEINAEGRKSNECENTKLWIKAIEAITYAYIREYHNALAEELKKSNIDIGYFNQ